jgi:hypothetical protein
MKAKLREHLKKVRETVAEVVRLLALHKYSDDSRTVIVAGLLFTIIEHHRSTLLLITSGSERSALSLIRDIVDGMYYGLWINACATPEQIHSIKTDDEFPVKLLEMMKATDTKYKANAFFQDVKNQVGVSLYKTNRSGIIQFGRWSIDANAGLPDSARELYDVTTAATACVLVLAAEFLAKQNHPLECKAVETLSKDYRKRPA